MDTRVITGTNIPLPNGLIKKFPWSRHDSGFMEKSWDIIVITDLFVTLSAKR